MIRTKWIVNTLRVIWVIFLLNNEFFIFWSSAKICSLWSSNKSLISPLHGKFMLVGDPQMTDDKSYNRHVLIMTLTKFYSDLYMRRNYRHLTRELDPSDIFFMGDLMDNGREWDDQFYDKEVNRFHKIFNPLNQHDKKMHYMVGNHDIGFGNGARLDLRERFERYFGNSSYVLETNYGYSFVVIDTVSLSSDDPEIRKSALAILEGELPSTPRILMTHVPLYREADVSCGPHRQKKYTIIPDQAGYQYQNLVSRELSDYILHKIKPVAVFSGDDHDYCKVSHVYDLNENPAVEITVPTFSMAQGLGYPGVMTLDLSNKNTLTTELCWLPDQIGIFIRYGYLFGFTLLVLVVYHLIQFTATRKKLSYSHLLSKEEMGLSFSTSTNTLQPKIMSGKRCLYSFFNSIKEVTLVGIITYILCIIFL